MTSLSGPVLVWLREDLRLADNPALSQAAETGRPVIVLYLLDDESPGLRAQGAASRWWLHESLESLDRSLQALGNRLLLRRGAALDVVPALTKECGVRAVLWNRRHRPGDAAVDCTVEHALGRAGIDTRTFAAALLHDPGRLRTSGGTPFRVFTPFWKALRQSVTVDPPLHPPARLPAPATLPRGDPLASWMLQPAKPDWAAGMRAAWQPGEQGAEVRLAAFLDDALDDYVHVRDLPDRPGTSMLSPHLHFGEISPRRVWHAVMARGDSRGAERYSSEIGWREFCWHLLAHNPGIETRCLQDRFEAFPWRHDPEALRAWQRGRTGYPLVDAGMRQLWTTGWMHNRVRMVVASFLVKHLMIDWREGEAWFWDTLVDADAANNPASWQWVAGCGADAAPYFRIFNPVLQGRKFDPAGAYVRRWVPEIAGLPDSHIHEPWRATPLELAAAGIALGAGYPEPIVAHDHARRRALEAFSELG